MNAIQEVKDENIRKIAQTLKSSGLASSETEAVRMAMMMSKTSQRVTQSFDQKRSGAGVSSGFPSQPSVPAAAQNPFNNVHASSSVQEKPRMTEEKEEFIFGDVQEKESAQKTDVYKVENEFEEVVGQELIATKEAPKEILKSHVQEAKPALEKPVMVNGRPSMFGSGKASEAYSKLYEPGHEMPKPVQHVAEPVHHAAPVSHVEPVQHVAPIVHAESVHSQQMPIQKPASTPSPTPVTATSSAQMAFASLLGDIQKTQVKHQEQKPAVQPSPAQASYSKPAEAAPVAQPQVHQPAAQPAMAQPAHVVTAHMPDPRANMMKEANVDLSKMFNVNK